MLDGSPQLARNLYRTRSQLFIAVGLPLCIVVWLRRTGSVNLGGKILLQTVFHKGYKNGRCRLDSQSISFLLPGSVKKDAREDVER